jgi:protoheme ferro-lyase
MWPNIFCPTKITWKNTGKNNEKNTTSLIKAWRKTNPNLLQDLNDRHSHKLVLFATWWPPSILQQCGSLIQKFVICDTFPHFTKWATHSWIWGFEAFIQAQKALKQCLWVENWQTPWSSSSKGLQGSGEKSSIFFNHINNKVSPIDNQ